MKKTFCMTLALLFTLTLAACGKTDSPAPAVSGNAPSDTSVVAVPPSGGQQNQPISQAGTSCTFDPALFGGKLQSCAYAGNGTLFVLADKLYLYDTGTSTVLATAEAPLSEAIDGGYVLSGMGDSGMMAYIYDSSLSLNKEIAVDELLQGDLVVSETGGVAASTDGKKLAFAALGGLYLYDLESGSLTTLLDMAQDAGTASIRISMLNGAAFAQDNSQIVFFGSGSSIPAADGEEDLSIYGSIAVDGSGLKLTTKPSGYDMEEMQSSASRLFFPQTFTQADGTLLWVDRATGSANTLSFSASGEGKDGVYGSEQGNYVATAVLGSNLTVRVYDVASGALVATEVIENSDPTYFNRIPRIYLLDGAKTAVVVLGGSIIEVDTLVSTFTFGE